MKALKKKGKFAIIGGDFRQISDAIFKGKNAISIMSKSTPEILKKITELVEVISYINLSEVSIR
jgi:hypothetical protein